MNGKLGDPPVEIFLGDEQGEIRRLLRSALRDLRLEINEDYVECDPLREAVQEGNPDLIIVDAELAGGDACSLVRAIRQDGLGANPFIPIIVTSWISSAERVRQLIDSGADGLLLKPVSISAIQNHINLIIHKRRPFIVTSSYIGPDRRNDPTHSSSVPRIDVPNTLRAKVNGGSIDWDELHRQIADRVTEINAERLRRNAFELSFLVEMTLANFDPELPDAKLMSKLVRLQSVTTDTLERLAGSIYEQSTDLCRTLLRVLTSIIEGETTPARIDLQFLKPLTDAVLAGFNPDRSAAEMTREIIESIGQYELRQKSKAEE